MILYESAMPTEIKPSDVLESIDFMGEIGPSDVSRRLATWLDELIMEDFNQETMPVYPLIGGGYMKPDGTIVKE